MVEHYEREPHNTEVAITARGIPGTESYAPEVAAGRYTRFLERGEAELKVRRLTEEFGISGALETARKEMEAEKRAELTAQAVVRSEDVADPIVRAAIEHEVAEFVKAEFADIARIENILIENQNKLLVVADAVPPSLARMEDVAGAEQYYMITSGTREENESAIFAELTRYGAKSRPAYSHQLDGAIRHYDENQFVGWRVDIKGKTFFFFFNGEDIAPGEPKKSEPTEAAS